MMHSERRLLARQWRPRAAVVVLAAAGLVPAASLALQLVQSGWWRGGADAVGAFDRRLAPLREALHGQTTVGYLPPAGSLEAPGGAAHFYLTRYALAPVIIVDQRAQPFIVADGVGDPARLPEGLEIARDFGGGLLLLRPRAP